jgi:hypothetical protein
LHNDEQSINWDKWFYSPGMPAFKPKFDESLAVICQELADRWTNWKPDTGNVRMAEFFQWLRIRIHLIRIWIQHLYQIRIWIEGFDVQKLKKIYY